MGVSEDDLEHAVANQTMLLIESLIEEAIYKRDSAEWNLGDRF